AGLYQAPPITGQIAQIADLSGRNEAAFQQAMFEQLRNPLAIFHVRLPPWYLLNVLWVDQQHFKVCFKQVEYRLPVNASTLHGDHFTTVVLQPVAHGQQLPGHSRKRSYFFPTLTSTIARYQTNFDILLVYINACTSGVYNTHGRTSYIQSGERTVA